MLFRRRLPLTPTEPETELDQMEREYETECAILLGIKLMGHDAPEPVWPVPTQLRKRAKAFEKPRWATVDLD